MLSAKAVRLLGLGAILITAIVAGTMIGTVAGDWKAESRQRTLSESLDGYLERNLRGIEVGSLFPDVDLWHADGVTAARLSDLLPGGGVIFYVSTACETCVDAIELLVTAQATAGLRARRVVIVTDGDPGPMMRTLAERGVAADIY
ncbi:MAG: hypothetical protein Kow0074_25160 [Candidatus Zixiibacteriota bacterium]